MKTSIKKTIILILSALMVFSVSASAADVIGDVSKKETKARKNAKKQKDIREVTFHVHLHCANCVKKVEENIAFEKGVKDLDVSLDHQTVAVKYDAAKTSEQTLAAAIAKLGYEVHGTVEPGTVPQHHEHHHHHNHN